MNNYKLVIEYDGTDFHGWQVQADARTVQGEIEKAISRMTCRPVRLSGSGRTDAGVHALGQVANFRCESNLTPDDFFSGLNSLLPDDLVIRSCEAVDVSFHSRFDAICKTYHYHILNRPLPIAVGRQYAWHIRKTLDLAAMREALSHIRGTHDFKAFENTGSPRSDTIRTVSDAAIFADADGENLTFSITANGFLRYMVRNLVGTLVEVGLSKLSPEEFAAVKNSRNRSTAGATAPPHGLFLMGVEYRKDKRHEDFRS